MSEHAKAHHHGPAHASDVQHPFVHFAFYRVDPAWRRLQSNEKVVAKQEFLSVFEPFYRRMLISSWSTMSLRADCDLMIWRIAPTLEGLQEMTAKITSYGAGRYLQNTHSYLGVASGPVAVETAHDHRRKEAPGHHRYLFIQPLTRTRDWRLLGPEERSKVVKEENTLHLGFPDVHVETVYALTLDDQEAVLAAETDRPIELINLSKALRASSFARYYLNDRPTFTCIRHDLGDILDQLG